MKTYLNIVTLLNPKGASREHSAILALFESSEQSEESQLDYFYHFKIGSVFQHPQGIGLTQLEKKIYWSGMAKTIRSFMAVEIPESNKVKILEFINRLKDTSGSFVKWVNEDNLHITLKFLGELNTDHISTIYSELTKRLCLIPSFNIQINRLGVFPNSRTPRIFWLGFDHNQNLDQIFSSIENCVVNLGYEADDKPFYPHLTIGRVRHVVSPGDIGEFTKNILNPKMGFSTCFQVNHVTLFKSELTRDGPIYTRLFQVSLSHWISYAKIYSINEVNAGIRKNFGTSPRISDGARG